MQFFHRGKPKSDGSRICTNVCVLHTEHVQIFLEDLRCELEELEITASLQRVHHHDAVKVG